ncbi:MAG: ABC transporter substrate-binding protein [Deltaproteobacteria bacterium]|nr:ABC transporter substrate-binding protein [Deltaproteobacteria bacterium]
MRIAALARLPLVALLALTACPSKDQGSGLVGADAKGEIVIGHVASTTGNEATFGISSDRGFHLFFDELNAKGGIKGRKIRLVTLDDQGKPEEAATAATRLIASDHVSVLLGEVASTRSLFMAPKAQMAKVPMVTPSSTNEKVTAVGDYIFRACFIDPFQGYVMAKFARENLKLNKVAILRDVRNDYSVGLAKVFQEEFTKMGGTIAGNESFSQGDVDFKAQLTNIKAQNPEAIFEPGYYTETGLIARQAREAGITVPLLGGDGWDSEKLYEIGGAALEGAYFSNHYSVDDPSPRVQDFAKRYKAAYNILPDSLGAQAYDAAGMLADAMNRATDLSGPAIRDALAATKNFQGVTGSITMEEHRNPVKPAVVLKIAKGGKYEFVTRIEPPSAVAAVPTTPSQKQP